MTSSGSHFGPLAADECAENTHVWGTAGDGRICSAPAADSFYHPSFPSCSALPILHACMPCKCTLSLPPPCGGPGPTLVLLGCCAAPRNQPRVLCVTHAWGAALAIIGRPAVEELVQCGVQEELVHSVWSASLDSLRRQCWARCRVGGGVAGMPALLLWLETLHAGRMLQHSGERRCAITSGHNVRLPSLEVVVVIC